MKSQTTRDITVTGRRRFSLPQLGFTAPLLLISTILALAVSSPAGQPFGPGGKRGVDVMQVNLYVGGEILNVAALDPTQPGYITNLIATVTGVYYEMVASQPPVRLQGVADQIAGRMPDLISVEEASLIRLESPGDLVHGGTNPATHVVYDYLQLLTNALAARGAHYAAVAVSYGLDAEMPMLNLQTGTIDDARLTDRNAILARTDEPPGQLRVANSQGGSFSNVVVTAAGLPLPYGWCSVDAFVRGQNFRYICAHLTTEDHPDVQVLQARELLAGPANIKMPVLLVGDFNADPFSRDGSLAYGLFPAAGFSDAWAVLHQSDLIAGLTWGHDEHLANPAVPFDRRIDLVFYRGAGFVPTQADVVHMALDRTAPPLWASDHAAVSAEFRLQ